MPDFVIHVNKQECEVSKMVCQLTVGPKMGPPDSRANLKF